MNVRAISGLRVLGLFLCCLLPLVACVSVPTGTGLDVARPRSASSSPTAWIAPVRILDPSIRNQASMEDSMAASIADFVRETRRFSEVDRLPGNPQRRDVILEFRFDRYRQQRVTHPAYFPAAIATLTLYTWFGGPIYQDVSDLSGMLTVKDAIGHTLAEARARVSENENVSLWSPRYASFDGKSARTVLIQELLDEASESVNGSPLVGLKASMPGRGN